jgi:hypothetical protein
LASSHVNPPAQKKDCFVISPIGPAGSDIRRKSDQIFKHVIQKALEPLSYRVERADHIQEPGIITRQIIQRINDVPLVVADLSGQNPNVFYELAIRHAIDKPVIHMISKGDNIPFDVSASRTVIYDFGDLDSLDAAKVELVNQVQSIESGKTVDNPITNAIGVKELKASGNLEQQTMADVLDAISTLRQEMIDIKQNMPRKRTRSTTLEEFPEKIDRNLEDRKAYVIGSMREMEKTLGFSRLVVEDKAFRERYKRLEDEAFYQGWK